MTLQPKTSPNRYLPLTPDSIWAFRKALGFSQAKFGIELSKIRGSMLPFTRGYISNLENGKQEITREIETALRDFHQLIQNDDYPTFINGTIKHHPGQVRVGSLYAGASKICRWVDCNNNFIPASPNQKQCPECIRSKRRS